MAEEFSSYTLSQGLKDPKESILPRHTRAPELPKPIKWPKFKAHFVAASAEFIGTTMFLFFAFGGTQVAVMSTPSGTHDPQEILFIALSFGFSLLVNVWMFYRVSGGQFNPAVTLGLCLSGALPWIRGLVIFPAQILGGIVAAALNSCMFPGPVVVVTKLSQGTTVAQGFFIEMMLTSLLVFAILMLAVEKHRATFVAPVGIGLALFVVHLNGVYFTGCSVNPTRSFGPSIVAHDFPHYHYIYWLGPFMGAILAAGYYRFLRYMEYELANSGQDDSAPQSETTA